jgi:hypothetical protein
MNGTILPAAEALPRFFPDAARVMAIPGGVNPERAKMLLVEGDLTVARRGLVATNALLPELTGQLADEETLVAIVVTGSLRAPDAVLMEPDYDWSPRFKVDGDMEVKSLCLGGSASLIGGDLTVSEALFGFYNHGRLHVGGRTTARIILAADYQFVFQGPVAVEYALSNAGRMNIPAAFEADRLHLVLHPDVIDDNNSVKDGEIIRWLEQDKSILRPARSIGKKPKPALSRAAKERIAAIMARAEAGEIITAIDLSKCELRFVPEEIRQFKALRTLQLSGNAVKKLPDWIGELAALTVLEAEDCGLRKIPDGLAHLPELRRLCVAQNDLAALPGGFGALEHLRVGGSYNDLSVDFVANLDLAPFPALRYAELKYAGSPTLTYSSKADQWNAPALEYLDIDCKLEGLPPNLFKAKRLKGLAITLTPDNIDAALDLKERLPDLDVLSLGYEDVPGAEVQAVASTLPGVYLRARYCPDFRIEMEHPLYRLNGNLGSALRARKYDEATPMAEQLIALLDLSKPRFEAEFIEGALRHCVDAFVFDAATASPTDKAAKVMRAAELADRILAFLPKTGALCWLLHQRDLGLLRLACLLGQANRFLHQPKPDRDAALAVLDAAQAEVDAWMDKTNAWFMERAGWIAALRAKV